MKKTGYWRPRRLIAFVAAALALGAPASRAQVVPLLWEIAGAVEPQETATITPAAADPGYASRNGATASEQASVGCFVGGTTGAVGAYLLGGENLVNLIAGGLVPAAGPALYVALGGVVFASFCAIGQAVTPVIVYVHRRYLTTSERFVAGKRRL